MMSLKSVQKADYVKSTTNIILRQKRSFCYPQTKSNLKPTAERVVAPCRWHGAKSSSVCCSLYVVYARSEEFTALTVMIVVSRMRRRVVWQAHKFWKESASSTSYRTDEAACSTDILVAATKLHGGLHYQNSGNPNSYQSTVNSFCFPEVLNLTTTLPWYISVHIDGPYYLRNVMWDIRPPPRCRWGLCCSLHTHTKQQAKLQFCVSWSLYILYSSGNRTRNTMCTVYCLQRTTFKQTFTLFWYHYFVQ